MQDNKQNTTPAGIPAKVSHRVKIISESSLSKIEIETNKFLDTISEERRLIAVTLTSNPKTGKPIQIINYQDLRPFTPEEIKERQRIVQGFINASNPQQAKSVENFGG